MKTLASKSSLAFLRSRHAELLLRRDSLNASCTRLWRDYEAEKLALDDVLRQLFDIKALIFACEETERD